MKKAIAIILVALLVSAESKSLFSKAAKSIGKAAKSAAKKAVEIAKSPEGQAAIQSAAQMALGSGDMDTLRLMKKLNRDAYNEFMLHTADQLSNVFKADHLMAVMDEIDRMIDQPEFDSSSSQNRKKRRRGHHGSTRPRPQQT